YAHRSNELFKKRKVITVSDSRPTTRSNSAAPKGKPTYHKIANGETLGSIARKYKVTVGQLQSWNGLRNTRISAGKSLKIYK
ncbi:MAG: LysM peptidoglycan-binding domain-containing protein, partial [Bacteroides sp.]|nr:LysM peptidoglycan-binding domain-containing protein [Bacteroides sp.]